MTRHVAGLPNGMASRSVYGQDRPLIASDAGTAPDASRSAQVLGHQEDAVVVLFRALGGVHDHRARQRGVDAGDAEAQRRACGGAEIEVGPWALLP